MKLNHIHVDFSRVQTGKQQAHVVTELYFKQPTFTLLQQMSNNSYRWLLRFDWLDLNMFILQVLIIF